MDGILGQIKESKNNVKRTTSKSEDSQKQDSIKSGKKVDDSEPEGIDGILNHLTEKDEEVGEELNFIERIIGVFLNPTKVFTYLRAKPDILIPLIIAILVSLVVSHLVFDIALDGQITQIENNDRIPDEQRDTIIDRIEATRQGPMRIVYSYIVPIIAVGLIFSVVSAIFLFIGNVILGGKARYVQIFSVYGYSYLIIAILGSIVKLPLIIKQHTIEVNMSPMVFFEGAEKGTALYNFLSSFDIFTLWFLVIFGIGFAVIYRFSQLKGIVSVFIAWLIYVLVVNVAIKSLVGGFMG